MRIITTSIAAVLFVLLGLVTGIYTHPTVPVTASLIYPAEHWAGNTENKEATVQWMNPVTKNLQMARTSWLSTGTNPGPQERGDTLTVQIEPDTGKLAESQMMPNLMKTLFLLALGGIVGFLASLGMEAFLGYRRRHDKHTFSHTVSFVKKEFIGIH